MRFKFYRGFSYSSLLDAAVLAFFCSNLWIAAAGFYFQRFELTSTETLWDIIPLVLLVLSTVFGFAVTAFHRIWAAAGLFVLHVFSSALFIGITISNFMTSAGNLVQYHWAVSLSVAGLSLVIAVLAIVFVADYRVTFGSPHPSTLAPYRSIAYVGMGSSTPIIAAACSFYVRDIVAPPDAAAPLQKIPMFCGIITIMTGIIMALFYRIRRPRIHLLVSLSATVVYFVLHLAFTLLLPFEIAAQTEPPLAVVAVVAAVAGHSFVQFAAPPSQQHILACLIVASEYSGMTYLMNSTVLEQHGRVSRALMNSLFALVGVGFAIYGTVYSLIAGKTLARRDFHADNDGYVSLLEAEKARTVTDASDTAPGAGAERTLGGFVAAFALDDAALGLERATEDVSEITQPVCLANEDANAQGEPGRFKLASPETAFLCVLASVTALAQGHLEQIADHTSTGLGPLIVVGTLFLAPLPRLPVFLTAIGLCIIFAVCDIFLFEGGTEFFTVVSGLAAGVEALLWPLFCLYSPRNSPILPGLFTALRWGFRALTYGNAVQSNRYIVLILYIVAFLLAAGLFEPKQRWRHLVPKKYFTTHRIVR